MTEREIVSENAERESIFCENLIVMTFIFLYAECNKCSNLKAFLRFRNVRARSAYVEGLGTVQSYNRKSSAKCFNGRLNELRRLQIEIQSRSCFPDSVFRYSIICPLLTCYWKQILHADISSFRHSDFRGSGCQPFLAISSTRWLFLRLGNASYPKTGPRSHSYFRNKPFFFFRISLEQKKKKKRKRILRQKIPKGQNGRKLEVGLIFVLNFRRVVTPLGSPRTLETSSPGLMEKGASIELFDTAFFSVWPHEPRTNNSHRLQDGE